MPGQGRLGDKAHSDADAHGCPGCPHPTTGPAIAGSADVFVNGRPALRVDDAGIHAPCCGPNLWRAARGAATVFINGKAAHRIGDETRHCGGSGSLIEGSADVIVGDDAPSGDASGWIAVQLVTRRGAPVKNRRYRLTTPDGRQLSGRLDERGELRADGFKPGTCKLVIEKDDGHG
jgi:uncharacterized Zn-binding protein involved in type VI secretion